MIPTARTMFYMEFENDFMICVESDRECDVFYVSVTYYDIDVNVKLFAKDKIAGKGGKYYVCETADQVVEFLHIVSTTESVDMADICENWSCTGLKLY